MPPQPRFRRQQRPDAAYPRRPRCNRQVVRPVALSLTLGQGRQYKLNLVILRLPYERRQLSVTRPLRLPIPQGPHLRLTLLQHVQQRRHVRHPAQPLPPSANRCLPTAQRSAANHRLRGRPLGRRRCSHSGRLRRAGSLGVHPVPHTSHTFLTSGCRGVGDGALRARQPRRQPRELMAGG